MTTKVKPAASPEPSVGVSLIQLGFERGGVPTITVCFGGKEANAVVNSGAAISTIALNLVLEHAQHILDEPVPDIRGAGNDPLPVIETTNIQVEMNGPIYPHCFAVLNKALHPILLGTDFARKAALVVDMNGPVVYQRVNVIPPVLRDWKTEDLGTIALLGCWPSESEFGPSGRNPRPCINPLEEGWCLLLTSTVSDYDKARVSNRELQAENSARPGKKDDHHLSTVMTSLSGAAR